MQVPQPNWLVAHQDAVIAGSLAIVVPWIAYLHTKKRLVYGVLSSPVVQGTDGLQGRIVISYDTGDGNPMEVRNVHTSRLTIRNSGAEISTSDFESPLTFSIPQPMKILSVAIDDGKPESIAEHATLSLSQNGQALIVSPLLLNRGDEISFSLVLSGVEDPNAIGERIKCDSRIKGIRHVTLIARDPGFTRQTLAFLVLLWTSTILGQVGALFRLISHSLLPGVQALLKVSLVETFALGLLALIELRRSSKKRTSR